MRNLENSIKKIQAHKGLLSKSIVCYTAKQTLNQYNWGYIKPKSDSMVELLKQRDLQDIFENHLINRKLDKDLSRTGIEWLKRFLFKKNGDPRENKDTRHVPFKAFDIVKRFSHFTFAGFSQDGNSSVGGIYSVTPIWRVHAKNGESFCYTYTGGAFQYGGGFEVFNLKTKGL